MGIMDFKPVETPVVNQATGRIIRPKAKVYLNVGYELPIREGEERARTITLPLGQGIDNMDFLAVKGQNDDWIMRLNAQNELLRRVQAVGDAMAPGELKRIMLMCWLQRVNDTKEIAEADNTYAMPAGFSLV